MRGAVFQISDVEQQKLWLTCLAALTVTSPGTGDHASQTPSIQDPVMLPVAVCFADRPGPYVNCLPRCLCSCPCCQVQPSGSQAPSGSRCSAHRLPLTKPAAKKCSCLQITQAFSRLLAVQGDWSSAQAVVHLAASGLQADMQSKSQVSTVTMQGKAYGFSTHGFKLQHDSNHS